MLTKFQKETLELMISDMNKNEIIEYKPSEVIWQNLCYNFGLNFLNYGINDVQNQRYYNGYFSGLWNPSSDLQSQTNLWLYYNFLKNKDKHNLLQKTSALDTTNPLLDYSASIIDGRPKWIPEKKLNWDYLISIDTILTIADYYPNILTDNITICELGAGWGRLAYYLTSINNKISYNIFDIPHTLLISSEYLRNSVSHTKVYTYQETINNQVSIFNKENLLKDPSIKFWLPHYLDFFDKKSFDIFINIASFQEMNIGQIEKYFERIDFLSNNLYTQQRYKDLEMEYSKYPIYNNWEKKLDKDINFHPLWFEQFYLIN